MYNRMIKWLAAAMTAPSFVAFFFFLVGFWIAFNSLSPLKFDPAPFMALNLVMSALAGIQATVVAVAQREEEERHRKQERYMLHLMEAVASVLHAEIQRLGGDSQDREQKGDDAGMGR